MSGEDVQPLTEFRTRTGYDWVDATHLLGHVAGRTDGDGWLWEPGTAAKLVDPYSVTYGGTDLSIPYEGLGPEECSSSPIINDRTREQSDDSHAGRIDVPVLCDVLGITDTGTLLGHWKDRSDGNGTVVALNIDGAEPPFDDPARRRTLANPQAPDRVTFATDLIAQALDADGDAS